uniref:Uncharacterized protein n=1 Tax=Anguilla anguilla TaxID=7936 RepID=A0A0E9VLR6_ANGAN
MSAYDRKVASVTEATAGFHFTLQSKNGGRRKSADGPI